MLKFIAISRAMGQARGEHSRMYALRDRKSTRLNSVSQFVLVLQWLYDTDPRGKETELVSLMRAAQDQGFSWKRDFYVDNGTFPRLPVIPGEDTQER